MNWCNYLIGKTNKIKQQIMKPKANLQGSKFQSSSNSIVKLRPTFEFLYISNIWIQIYLPSTLVYNKSGILYSSQQKIRQEFLPLNFAKT